MLTLGFKSSILFNVSWLLLAVFEVAMGCTCFIPVNKSCLCITAFLVWFVHQSTLRENWMKRYINKYNRQYTLFSSRDYWVWVVNRWTNVKTILRCKMRINLLLNPTGLSRSIKERGRNLDLSINLLRSQEYNLAFLIIFFRYWKIEFSLWVNRF